ncbi:MAG: PatB family C-S lyase [Candidatus Krumholzibacteriia bacterium]
MSQPYDFDRPIDRTGTACIKWDRYAGQDILPLWVADTDFQSPPEVAAALHERVDHGVFGYTQASAELTGEVVDFLARTFRWRVEPDWLVWLPGLVSGLSVCCRAFAGPADGVLTTTPIYPPFLRCPVAMERTLQTAPLCLAHGRWVFDWDAFAAAIDPRTRLFLFCSPHNPCGRLWTREELQQLADACARHDLIVCSDEIHNQLVLDDSPHVPLATLSPEVAARTVTLMAPSKTYNIAGLACSYAIIPDPELRRRFTRAAAMIVPHPNLMGYTAALAAYRHGGPWLAAQLEYLREARDLIEAAVAELPGVSMTHVEATYLAWLDCRELQLAETARHFEDHGLGFQAGREFGLKGFVRWNFGTTHANLREALARFERGVRALG